MSEGKTIAEKFQELRDEGLENAFNLFYSLYPAKVQDAADPQQQGRSQVLVRMLGYSDPIPKFSYPVSPYAGENYGFYFPAHKDSSVWVTFDQGDTHVARVLGSWWPNKDKASEPRSPSMSHVPAEFVKSDGSEPTARGIKIKEGHGLIFEGDGNDSHVELWTGANQAVGSPATRQHRVRLDDQNEQIVVMSTGGQQSTWRDAAGEVYVEHKTTDNFRVLIDSTNQKVLLETPGGNMFVLDDVLQKIEATTAGGNVISMDDLLRKISLMTAQGQIVELDDNLQKVEARTSTGNQLTLDGLTASNRMLTPAGQILTQGPGTTSVVEPAAVTVTAGGALSMQAVGVTVTSAAGGASVQDATGVTNNNFTGLKTDNLIGGYVGSIPGGVWSLVGASLISLGGAIVSLGTGVQVRLVTEEFFTAYNVHTHNTTIVGAPTGPPITGIGIPGTHTTIQTTAS